MANIALNFVVVDSKGARSTIQLNTGDGDVQTFEGLEQVAEQATVIISALTLGRIEKVTATIALAATDNSTAPIEGSDVEEGARFVSRTNTNFSTSVRIPTFNEEYISPTSRLVDLDAAQVVAFVDMLEDGIALSAPLTGTALFRDYRGDEIQRVVSALESFTKSRR